MYARCRGALFEAYQRESGRVCSSYYCENIVAGAVRTDRPRLALAFNSGGWEGEEELLTRCDALYWEGIDYLAGADRATFVERLYSVVTDVLALLDRRYAPAARTQANGRNGRRHWWHHEGGNPEPADEGRFDRARGLAACRQKLEDIRAFYRKAAPKRARLRYLLGLAVGTVATAAVASLFLALLALSDVIGADQRSEVLGTFCAGAVGAVVSVMQRVSSATLSLNHEAGRAELVLLGAMRPLIGAVVAVAIYALLAGGVLDFALPETTDSAIYYYVGIGFLSGFSERFAQDMLLRTGHAASNSAEPDARPSRDAAANA